MSTIQHMIRGLRSGGLLCGALALGLAAGCGAAATDAPEVEAAAPAVAGLLTSVRLPDGAQVDFHEPEAGRVLIVATGVVPQLEGKISPVALYEELAGAKAPAALIQAEQRAALGRALRAQQPKATVAPVTEATLDPLRLAARSRGGVGASVHALTATQFSASYCPGGTYNFFYCLTNRTGDGTLEISSVDWLRTYASPYRGQIRLKLSYKNFWGNWITLGDVSAPEDSVKTFYTADNDTYKVEINEGSGDGWHWSVYGEK